MYEPSVDAKNFRSLTKSMNADTKLAPLTLSASSLIWRSRSIFGCSGMSNGFFSTGVFHSASAYVSTGASTTGSELIARFAFAMPTACRATAATSSFVTALLLAKPHVPSTSTRTPNPKSSVLTMFWTLRSRVKRNWLR